MTAGAASGWVMTGAGAQGWQGAVVAKGCVTIGAGVAQGHGAAGGTT